MKYADLVRSSEYLVVYFYTIYPEGKVGFCVQGDASLGLPVSAPMVRVPPEGKSHSDHLPVALVLQAAGRRGWELVDATQTARLIFKRSAV